MSKSKVWIGLLSGVAALGLAGCFSYTPVEFEAVPPGDHVRIYVTRAVVDDLDEVAVFTEPVVSGTLLRREGDGLFLRIPVGVRREGFHSMALTQDVRIPVGEIVQTQRRDFDRLATGSLVVGTLAGAATVMFYIMKAFGEDEEVEDCPECVDMRLPVISFPRLR